MRKEKEIITVNGNQFVLVKYQSLYRKANYLGEVYKNPSCYKQQIFRGWENVFYQAFISKEISDYEMFITSSNSNFFTLGGWFVKNGTKYAYKITYANTVCWIAD